MTEVSTTSPSATPGWGPALAVFIFTAWQSFWTSGIVFGWTPLLMLLKQEGVYASKCPTGVEECSERDVALNLMFTLGTISHIFGGVVSGPIPYPKLGLIAGVLLIFAGSVTLAFADPESEVAFPLAYICQGLGGGLVHFGAMSIGYIFGPHRGYIMACLAGCLGVSSMVYQIFYALYSSGVSRQTLFLIHAAILLVNAAGTAWLWSFLPYRAGDAVVFRKGRMVVVSTASSIVSVAGGRVRASGNQILKAAVGAPFIAFVIFLLSQLWFSRCLMGMYSAELAWKNDLLEENGSATLDVDLHLTLFNLSQGLLGSTMIPLFGLITTRLGHRGGPALATGILSVVWLGCILIPAIWPLYILYFFAGWHRHFFFATFLNFMTSEYPPEVYGKLLPVVNIITGASVALQNPVLSFILNDMDGDFYPFLALMLALAIGIAIASGALLLWERRSAAAAAAAASGSNEEGKQEDSGSSSKNSKEKENENAVGDKDANIDAADSPAVNAA